MTEKAEVFNLTETPEPTPAALTPLRTDSDMLQEIFEQFSTAKEARKHIKDVAAGQNKFNQTFGESSIRKVIAQKCKFKGDAGKIESREATAHIGAGSEMEIQPEATSTAEAPTQEQADQYMTPEATPQNFGSYEAVKAELQPIQERSCKGILENVFSIAGLKGEGKDSEILTDQEGKDTVTLIPYILKKVMKTDMTQDNYETLTIAMHAGNLVSKVVKKRIEKGKMFKEQKPEAAQQIPTMGLPTPAAEPTPETPSQVTALTEEAPSIDQQTEAFKKRQI